MVRKSGRNKFKLGNETKKVSTVDVVNVHNKWYIVTGTNYVHEMSL